MVFTSMWKKNYRTKIAQKTGGGKWTYIMRVSYYIWKDIILIQCGTREVYETLE